jgi:hypothetical protein
MSTTIKLVEKVEFDLTADEPSVAKVVVSNLDDSERDAYVSNSVSFHLSADLEEREVWVSITGHTFVRLDNVAETVTTHVDYLSHRFTEVEARALLATLVHELAKLD